LEKKQDFGYICFDLPLYWYKIMVLVTSPLKMIVEILQWLQHRKGQGFTTRYMTNKNTSLVLSEANTDSLFGFDIWLAFRIPGLKGCMQSAELELKS